MSATPIRQAEQEKYPMLRCPKCGFELSLTLYGWAVSGDKNTKCRPGKASVYAHPFEVVK